MNNAPLPGSRCVTTGTRSYAAAGTAKPAMMQATSQRRIMPAV
jgi:hypothetical protein